MVPSTTFCLSGACPDKGRVGAGNIGIHSQKERRYRCKTCRVLFAATTVTPYYRACHPLPRRAAAVRVPWKSCLTTITWSYTPP